MLILLYEISLLLAKFAFFSLAVNCSDVVLLISWVVIHLSGSWSVVILFSVSLIFVLCSCFLDKLPTLGILFSTGVTAVVVAKLVILGILFWISLILGLKVVLVAKLLISGILSSLLFILGLLNLF